MKRILMGIVLCIGVVGISGCTKQYDYIAPSAKNSDSAKDTAKEDTDGEQQTENEEGTAVGADANTGDKAEENSAEEQGLDPAEWNRLRIRDHYYYLLVNFQTLNELPNGETFDTGDGFDQSEGNQFVISDVDGDGKEELLLALTATYTAGQLGYIYGYDPETNVQTEELVAFPYFINIYDNGVLQMGISHNQGKAGDILWPYDLYTYNKERDVYDWVYFVDGWDGKAFPEEFPAEVDRDGNKAVYNCYHAGDGNTSEWMDDAEYKDWLSEYIKDGKELNLTWNNIASEDFYTNSRDLARYLYDNYVKEKGESKSDIGNIYMKDYLYESDYSANEKVIDRLEQDYGVEVEDRKQGEFTYKSVGKLDGETVFEAYYEGGETIMLKNKQIDDVNILGIYPGMSYEDAKKILEEFGFYEKKDAENVFVTGENLGNFWLVLMEDGGTVTEIQLSEISMY
ncbi:MAG: hypothetical protein IJ801_06480 [Lachnospiraceae bacterium]|nr:hypothetical protein [Lachnospiraceae bacterium]